MKYGLVYASVIAVASVLLLTTLFVSTEAVPLDKENTVVVKGDAISVQSSQITLFIGQINNIKNTNTLNYVYFPTSTTFELGLGCTAPSSILKSSALKKATIEFHTSDAVGCFWKTTGEGNFSISIEASGSSDFKKYDDITCSPLGDVQYCTRIRGTSDESIGTASGTVFGEALRENVATISKMNEKRTAWISP